MLLPLLLFLATDPGGNATLLGIAALVTPITAVAVAYIARPKDTGSDDDQAVEDAKARVRDLQQSADDLRVSLAECREDRRIQDAEMKLLTMKLGQLEAQLATCKLELREATRER